jgi:hypothetical protein
MSVFYFGYFLWGDFTNGVATFFLSRSNSALASGPLIGVAAEVTRLGLVVNESPASLPRLLPVFVRFNCFGLCLKTREKCTSFPDFLHGFEQGKHPCEDYCDVFVA